MIEIIFEIIKQISEQQSVIKGVIFIISLAIPWKFLKHAYESFAYDSFDLLLKSKEKRNFINHTKEFSIFLFTTGIFMLVSLAFGFVFSINNILISIYLIIVLLYCIVYLIWSIFYMFRLYKILNSIVKRFTKYKKEFKINELKQLNLLLLYFLIILSSGSISLFLIIHIQSSETASFNVITNLLLLIIASSTPMYFVLKSANQKSIVKYKFVGTYNNSIPIEVNELFLDTVIDNYVQVLTSESGDYKAIRYRSQEILDMYSIDLYKKNSDTYPE